MIPDSRLIPSGLATFTSTDSTTALLPELELAIRALNSRMRATSATGSEPRSVDSRQLLRLVPDVGAGNPANASSNSASRPTGTIKRPRIQLHSDRECPADSARTGAV